MKQSGVKVILTEDYRSRRFSDLLARQSGGVVVSIPAGVGDKGVNDYFTLMDTIGTPIHPPAAEHAGH